MVMQWFAVNDDASGSQLMMMRVVKIVCFVFILVQIEIEKVKIGVSFYSMAILAFCNFDVDEQRFLHFYFALG